MMSRQERDAMRQRLMELGVDAEWATRQAINVGEQCIARGINLQTLLLFALVIWDGCRDGLEASVVATVEEINRQTNADADEKIQEARS
jgi:hypothetical protein